MPIILIAALGVAWEWQFVQRRRNEATDLVRVQAELTAQIKRQQSEIGSLKAQIRVWEAVPPASPANSPESRAGEIMAWAERLGQLRRFFEAHPEQAIPEMRLLSQSYWLFEARTGKTDTPEALRKSPADIRNTARALLNEQLAKALPKYLAANQGMLPGSLLELAPFLGPEIDAEMLGRYRMLVSGKATDNQGNVAFSEQVPAIDEQLDVRYYFGIETFSSVTHWVQGELQEARQDARIAFAQANGRKNQGVAELLPYISSPAHRGYLEATLAYSAANAGKSASSLADLQPFLPTPEAKGFAERFWAKASP